MRAIISIVAFASVCLVPLGSYAQDLNGFEARTLQGSKGVSLPYRLFKVANPVAGTKYPLILFLHGAGGARRQQHLAADGQRGRHGLGDHRAPSQLRAVID